MSSENGYAGTQVMRPGDLLGGREQLADIQRARIIAAMVDVASKQGSANVTVAKVVARSGVSRRTFYELFGDCADCLLAAMEDALGCARSYAREADDPSKQWLMRIRLVLHSLLRFLEDEPARGRLLVVESLGAGPQALERRARVLEELVLAVDAAIDAGKGKSERGAGLTSLTTEGIVGSALAIIHARLVRASPSMTRQRARPGNQEGDSLIALTNPLMSMIALPYLGAAAARKELDRPLPEYKRRPARAASSADQLNGLPMRVTYRTMVVLDVIAAQPGASNREIGVAAEINDQGQMSKLLQRLERLGLIVNHSAGQPRGLANAWRLTSSGADLERATRRSHNTEH